MAEPIFLPAGAFQVLREFPGNWFIKNAPVKSSWVSSQYGWSDPLFIFLLLIFLVSLFSVEIFVSFFLLNAAGLVLHIQSHPSLARSGLRTV